MRFEPKSQQQLEDERQERLKLLKEGRGTFTVLTGETKSKHDPELGNIEYHLLTVDAWDSDGAQRQIQNVCLHPKMLEFVRGFCFATGLGREYEAGVLTLDDCLGKSGECMIAVEKGDSDGKGGKYPDKNKIKSWVVAGGSAGSSPPIRPPSSAPGQGVPAAAAAAARREAWVAFQTKYPGEPDWQASEWKQHFATYFSGREQTQVRADEWRKFTSDGFRKREVPSPLSNDMEFKDDDIPF